MKLMSVYLFPGAATVLYALLLERSKHSIISHNRMPSLNAHTKFVGSKPYDCWYIVVVHDTAVGAISATFNNEISIGIFKKYRRQRYALRALQMFVDSTDPLPAIPGKRSGRWLANINPKNKASIALFKRLGFKHLQNTYAL